MAIESTSVPVQQPRNEETANVNRNPKACGSEKAELLRILTSGTNDPGDGFRVEKLVKGGLGDAAIAPDNTGVGRPPRFQWHGTTLEGDLQAAKWAREIEAESLRGRLREAALVVAGWAGGFASCWLGKQAACLFGAS
jgi:hypothetical protein